MKTLVLHAFLLALGVVAGAAFAEAGVRAWAALDARLGRQLREYDPLGGGIEPVGDFGYRQRPNHAFHYANGTVAHTNALGFRGPVVEVRKPAGTVRVLLLGESTTHGWAVNDSGTIDAYLRQLLKEHYSTSTFEVVNLAFDGYDSNQLFERLRNDGLRLNADLIIVNTGINDVRNARISDLQDRDVRTLLYGGVLAAQREVQRRGRLGVWTQVKHASYAARLPGIIRSSLAHRSERAREPSVVPNPAAVEYFGRNLQRIRALFTDRPVPLVFATPPSALATGFAPSDTSSISYWIVDAGTTQRYRDALAQRMLEVVGQFRREGYPARYVRPTLTPGLFLDDCHLTAEGNRAMAEALLQASKPFLDPLIADTVFTRHGPGLRAASHQSSASAEH